MELDMYIYRDRKGREQSILQLEKIVEEANDYAIELCLKPEVQNIVTLFLNKYTCFMCENKDLRKKAERDVKSILYGNTDLTTTRWNLFNNCSVFNFGLNDEQKNSISLDLLDMLKNYKTTQKQLDRLKQEAKLDGQIHRMRIEVAYWRKYHDLNDYILKTYGGDNCEETVLYKKDMNDILQFVKNDGKNTDQLEEILSDWNTESTYVYCPWW